VRCNVFEYSAVIGATGRVNPCFFISGPPAAALRDDLGGVLNSDSMMALRESLRSGTRPECSRCVCSLWREPEHRVVSDFLPLVRSHA
jgi:radical SAM protein with 4Fe4S-binding SPASM domain